MANRGLVEVVVHYYKAGYKIEGPADAHALWLKDIIDTTDRDPVQAEGAQCTRFVFNEDNVGIDLIVAGCDHGYYSCAVESEIENTSLEDMFDGYPEEFVKIADAIKEILKRPKLPEGKSFNDSLKSMDEHEHLLKSMDDSIPYPIRFMVIISVSWHPDGGWEDPYSSYCSEFNFEGLLNLNNDSVIKEAGEKTNNKVFSLDEIIS